MINVIGLGYIGLPTALMLAAHGQAVVGTDYNAKIVNALESGTITFEEKGLEDLFQAALNQGITFSTEYQKADYYIVSVPTPYDAETKKIDTTFVEVAVKSILDVCSDGVVIVIESTVSPGTIDKYLRPLVVGREVHLVHAPERIIPGNMIHELVENSRTIGADSQDIALRVKSLYASFCKAEIALTDIRTAELTKVVENTYRDVNIAFANELARLCKASGLDVREVIRIANMHPRVNILQSGPGVGGHCISVDPWFLVGDFPEIVDVIHAARRVNDGQPAWILSRIKEIMAENGVSDFSQVGLYGLTYKEDVDDVRESPTLQLLNAMGEEDASSVVVYDPHVADGITKNQCHSFKEFLTKVDMVVVLVGHKEIRQHLGDLKGKIVFDTRNVCDLPGAIYL